MLEHKANKGFAMSDNKISTFENTSFENLKKINEHNAEYWSARELQPHLGYTQWRRFEEAIKRAMDSCETSGNKKEYHFANVGKMVEIGSGALR